MSNAKTKTDFQGKCLPDMRSRKGGVLIPALFLMVLFIALGGALLSLGQTGVGITTSAVKAHQAYYTAKSALDLFTSSLTGENVVNAETKEPFKSLNEMLSPMEKGSKISAVGTAAGDANIEITCTDKVKEDLLTTQTFLIKATGICGTAERTLTREITLERTFGGKFEGQCLGTGVSGAKTEYSFEGKEIGNTGKNAVIKGGLRIENALEVEMSNVTIDGDLYIYSENNVELENVVVNGNVYIECRADRIKLENCEVNASGKVAAPKTILVTNYFEIIIDRSFKSAGSVYVSAPWGLELPRGKNKFIAQKLYLANDTAITTGTMPSAESIVSGSDATAALKAAREKVITNPIELHLPTPPQKEEDYDFVLDGSTINKFNFDIDASGGKTLNYLIKPDVIGMLMDINVKGDGTVNFYVASETGVTNCSLDNIIITRENAGIASVNFINLSVDFEFALTNRRSEKFDANIIVPYGSVDTDDCTINGIVLAGKYEMSGGFNSELINAKVPWANTGSLAITNGDETVKGTAGGYGK